jgi:hypothetical protein
MRPGLTMVPKSEIELDAGFIRQRRNLIIVSLSLLAALHYGLTLERINLLGNETRLPGPHSVAGFLWWFWAYFLWRYWTAFMDIEDRGIVRKYEDLVWRRLQTVGARWYKGEGIRLHPGSQFGFVALLQGGVFRKPVLQVNIKRDKQRDDVVTESYPVRPLTLWWHIVMGLVSLVFQTSKISEFIIPYFFALAPVVYCGAKHFYFSS